VKKEGGFFYNEHRTQFARVELGETFFLKCKLIESVHKKSNLK